MGERFDLLQHLSHNERFANISNSPTHYFIEAVRQNPEQMFQLTVLPSQTTQQDQQGQEIMNMFTVLFPELPIRINMNPQDLLEVNTSENKRVSVQTDDEESIYTVQSPFREVSVDYMFSRDNILQQVIIQYQPFSSTT